MQNFTIENPNDEILTIIIEPWAEEYYLKKNQVIEIQQELGIIGYYHQIIHVDHIQLYVEGNYDNPKVLIDGKEADPFDK